MKAFTGLGLLGLASAQTSVVSVFLGPDFESRSLVGSVVGSVSRISNFLVIIHYIHFTNTTTGLHSYNIQRHLPALPGRLRHGSWVGRDEWSQDGCLDYG